MRDTLHEHHTFADDIDMAAGSNDELQDLTIRDGHQRRQEQNNGEHCRTGKGRGVQLEEAKSCKCLGVTLSKDGSPQS